MDYSILFIVYSIILSCLLQISWKCHFVLQQSEFSGLVNAFECQVRVFGLKCSSWQQSQRQRKVYKETQSSVCLTSLCMKPLNILRFDLEIWRTALVDATFNSPDVHKIRREWRNNAAAPPRTREVMSREFSTRPLCLLLGRNTSPGREFRSCNNTTLPTRLGRQWKKNSFGFFCHLCYTWMALI